MQYIQLSRRWRISEASSAGVHLHKLVTLCVSNSPAHATSIMADDIVRTRKVRRVGVRLHPARLCAAASGHASAPFLAAIFLLPGLWSAESRLFYFLTCAKTKVVQRRRRQQQQRMKKERRGCTAFERAAL
uniref:Uncharacterized protein n=1 Tax=Trichogramma kaykai TaxID=54128 RepID=A0ABD2WBA5_9HYME